MKTTRRFWVLLLVLLFSGAFIHLWERGGEARVSRKTFNQFPAQVGAWKQLGTDLRFDDETETILRADDYVARNFTYEGHVVSFYAGYYGTQRTGATYHSPLNCLPGSGWMMTDSGEVVIPRGNGQSFKANRYVIQKGNERAMVIYWYEGRGRAIAGEYWAKIYTVVDSVTRRRSDGALIRVIAPIENSPAEAQRLAVNLASQAADELPAFVPN